MTTKFNYTRTVQQIKLRSQKILEEKIAIGKLVSDAVAHGYPIGTISVDTGVSVSTLKTYCGVYEFWGDTRMSGPEKWSAYVKPTQWNEDFVRDHKVKQQITAAENGPEAITQLADTYYHEIVAPSAPLASSVTSFSKAQMQSQYVEDSIRALEMAWSNLKAVQLKYVKAEQIAAVVELLESVEAETDRLRKLGKVKAA